MQKGKVNNMILNGDEIGTLYRKDKRMTTKYDASIRILEIEKAIRNV